MKTSIEIDEKKLEMAKKLAPTSTMRELIDKALDAYIAQARKNSMFKLLGTNFFEGDLKKMRDKKK